MQKLVKQKRMLVMLLTMFAFLFYFGLPLSITFFPEIMNAPSPIMQISWAWLYAFLQIPMTWVLVFVYYSVMKRFDRLLKKLVQGDAA